MINQVITGATVFFLVLGGIDYLLGNRFGLGAEFEKGISASGRLLLVMTGFLVLAPVIAKVLSPVVVPAFRAIGADPSLFAGILFAGDSGGAVLAIEMADDPNMGLFNGLIVGSMLGATVMFNIPLCIANIPSRQRPAAVYGLLAGIITIPLGCLAGGLAAGFEFRKLILNTVPILAIAAVLAIMLVVCRDAVVKFLTLFGQAFLALSIIGLVISSFQALTSIQILEGMASLDEAFAIIGNICIFLAGIFPLLAVLRKVLAKPLEIIGTKLSINDTAVSAFLLALANGIPVVAILKDMDDKGCMLNVAFLVSASCVLGDHLAYTTQVAPSLCNALIIGKLVGGIAAILLALLLAPHLLSKKD